MKRETDDLSLKLNLSTKQSFSNKNLLFNFNLENESLIKKYIDIEINGNSLQVFKDYLKTIYKIDFDTLTSLSFDKVMSIIEEFKFSHDIDIVNTPISLVEKKENEKNPTGFDLIEEERTVFFPCKLLSPSVLTNKRLYITISNTCLIEKGIFQSNYILYTILTMPFTWTVQRRYSEFETLRLLLMKAFPGYLLPPIPNKKYGVQRFEKEFIEKRQYYLTRFLDNLLSSDVFKRHQLVIDFLSIEDREAYESRLTEYISQNQSIFQSLSSLSSLSSLPLSSKYDNTYISDYYSPSGTACLSFENNNDNIYNNILSFTSSAYEVYDSLNQKIKQYETHSKQASFYLEELRKDIKYLSFIYKNIKANEEYHKLYEELNIFLKQMRISHENDLISFKNNIKMQMKYIQMELLSFKDLLKKREDAKTLFSNGSLSLKAKKDKLWTTKEYSKWELAETLTEEEKKEVFSSSKENSYKYMCYKEGGSVEEMKRRLGYYDYRIKEEYKEMIYDQYLMTKSYIEKYLNDIYPSLTKGITIWSNFNMVLSMFES